MSLQKLRLVTLLGLVLPACGPQSSPLSRLADTPPPVVATPAAAVALLDGGITLDPTQITFTAGTILNPTYVDATGATGTFASNVIKVAEAKFVGYLLPVAKNASGSFVASGALQGFTARYATTATAYWQSSGSTPAAPNFSEDDVKAVASSPQLVTIAGASGDNLRLYVSNVRTGYASGAYKVQQGLMLFYIDPTDGHRVSFLYSPSAPQVGLFRVAAAAIPALRAASSVVNVVATADLLTAVLPGAPTTYQVPYHTYDSQTFRVVGTQTFQGTTTPLGVPVALNAAAAATVDHAWTAIQTTSGQLTPTAYEDLLAVIAEAAK